MNLSLFIAKRYLISKKSHNAINIITYISVAGVSIGTMALIIVLSAFNGISDLVFGLYNTFDPDIKIIPKEGKTFLPDSIAFDKIKKLEGVAYYTEVLQENALLKYDDKQVIATIKGVSDDFVKMTRLDTVIREGEFRLMDEGRDRMDDVDSLHQPSTINHQPLYSAVLGYGIARRLNISLTDFMHPLEIYIPKRGKQSYLNPEDAFTIRSVEVSGVFSLNDDFDFKYCILPLSLARTLLERKNELSAVEIGLEKGKDKNKIKDEIQNILGKEYEVKTRYEQNEVLFKTINSEKWWTFLILAFILVIATFNVIGSLTMLIIEKKKDIQTLMFLGADKLLIRKIFMREGLMITFTGAVAGLLLGLLLCWIQIQFKPVPFSEGFIVDAYPVKIVPMDLLLVFATVLFIGFFAAWYPVKIFTQKIKE
ncbi:MAG: ABC transporter permease [Bacteroidetes bacterium]|nr:ABC transporter permease [Bacteroidota bacterium]